MTARGLNLVPFTNEQIGTATNLFVRVFAEEPWNEFWPNERALRRLQDVLHSPGFLGVSALRGEELVGFALGRMEAYRDEDHFYLQEMCVSPAVQRQGVGTRIFKHLHEELRAKECNQVYLLTARESFAEKFYVSNGYRGARRACMLITRLG